MYNNIDELIEINLKLLTESDNHSIWRHEFVDENGHRFTQPQRFSKIMESKGLITIEPTREKRCDLTEKGYEIAKNGGWLEYLRVNKLLEEKENLESKKKKIIQKINNAKLTNEYKLSKWQVKTFWLIFIFAIFSGFYSIYDLVSKIKDEEISKDKIVTKEIMESELSKLRTLILSQKTTDSIPKSNITIDSLEAN